MTVPYRIASKKLAVLREDSGKIEGSAHTSQISKACQICLSQDLCMLKTRSKCGDIDFLKGCLERVQDNAVRAITDGMDVLSKYGCNVSEPRQNPTFSENRMGDRTKTHSQPAIHLARIWERLHSISLG